MKTRRLPAALAALFVATAGAATAQQAPQGFNYQGIARDAGGAPLTNQALSVRISILDGAGGTPQYVETHQTTTNAFGLFTLQIGAGTRVSGSFAGVTWANGNKQIKTEIDLGGGYADLGTSPLMSVPYALVAGTTAAPPQLALGDLTDVNAGAPANGQVLKWNGSNWVAGSDLAGFELPFAGTGNSTALTPLFDVSQGGTGGVARFSQSNPQGAGVALVLENRGTGSTLSSTASGVTGSAGVFNIDNIDNGHAAVSVMTTGVGNAGYFEIRNRNSDSAAVHALTNGTAPGVYGQATGNGRAYGIYGRADGECVDDLSGLRRFCPAGVFGTAWRGPGVFGYNSGLGAGVKAYSEMGNLFEGFGPTQNAGFDDLRFYVDNTGRSYGEQSFYTPQAFSSSRSAMAHVITPGDTGVAEGDVLVVNANGAFVESTDTNQTTVVGIVVSNPAFLSGNELDEEGNELPTFAQTRQLAVAGIVTVNVSDENGAIAPGDLLVSSSTPGHAMKAPADPAPGTVVAKALGTFGATGTGSIRAIVMLR